MGAIVIGSESAPGYIYVTRIVENGQIIAVYIDFLGATQYVREAMRLFTFILEAPQFNGAEVEYTSEDYVLAVTKLNCNPDALNGVLDAIAASLKQPFSSKPPCTLAEYLRNRDTRTGVFAPDPDAY